MQNFSAANTRDGIPYRKQYRSLTGSVTAALLFQQLEYWFGRYPNGFYKFLSPPDDNRYYKDGDSWAEELGFSEEEFRTAFDRIGTRYKSRTEYDAEETKFQVTPNSKGFYSSFLDRRTGQTFYFRNHNVVDGALTMLNSRSCTIIDQVGDASLQNLSKSVSTTGQSQDHLKVSEITTETTTKEEYMCSSDEHTRLRSSDSQSLITPRVQKNPVAVQSPNNIVAVALEEFSGSNGLFGCTEIEEADPHNGHVTHTALIVPVAREKLSCNKPLPNAALDGSVARLNIDKQQRDLAAKESAFRIFEYWKKIMQKKSNTDFTQKRERAVLKRLDKFSEDQLRLAIDGCALDDFSMARGKFKGDKAWNDLERICRDTDHVEGFLEAAMSHKQKPQRLYGSGISKDEMNDNRRWLNRKES